MNLMELEKEWHPTKNLPLTFSSSLKVSSKYWWLSKCGHEWDAPLISRQKGQECPICANRRVLVGFNDLASRNPELAAEWHPTKNGELTASEVVAGGKRKFWWFGKCAHEWEAIMENRIHAGHGCPYCTGRRALVGFNDLASTEPTIAAEWHPTKNGELTAQQITRGTPQKVWWQCSKNHAYESSVSNRTGENKRGCPICSGQKVLAGFNDLASLDPVVAAEWHPTKNGELTAQQVTRFTRKKVWWQGTGCGHEWLGIIANRTIQRDKCPYCSSHRVLAGHNDLSSIRPDVAKEWHPTKNGELTAQQITHSSPKKVWWECSKAHEWKAAVSKRTGRNDGCPTCSGRKVLIGFNDLASQVPLIATEWHPIKNGALTPADVYQQSQKKVWWIGSCSHEWEAGISHRTVRGQGCRQCTYSVSKAEKQIQTYLESFGVIVEGSNRTILNGKEIDIWLPEYRIGIEFNGIYWHNEKFAGSNSHLFKWQAAKAAGIQLIQIWEDDWNLHPEIIMRTLAHKLKVSKPDSAAQSAKVIHLTERQATEFLDENYLKGFASGQYYLGLVETGDTKTLRAVMVLDSELNGESQSLEIIRYASTADVSDDFNKFLSYACNAYTPEFISVIADNCEGDDWFYVNHEFIAEKEISPDYMYVIRTERKPRSDYSLERFRGDPTLIWEKDLTEIQLADLNGLKRIWDAGKTRYRFVVGK